MLQPFRTPQEPTQPGPLTWVPRSSKPGHELNAEPATFVSVEFAVLYHWYAASSAADADWMEDLLRTNFPELGSIDDMIVDMFKKVVMAEGHKLNDTEYTPQEWDVWKPEQES